MPCLSGFITLVVWSDILMSSSLVFSKCILLFMLYASQLINCDRLIIYCEYFFVFLLILVIWFIFLFSMLIFMFIDCFTPMSNTSIIAIKLNIKYCNLSFVFTALIWNTLPKQSLLYFFKCVFHSVLIIFLLFLFTLSWFYKFWCW